MELTKKELLHPIIAAVTEGWADVDLEELQVKTLSACRWFKAMVQSHRGINPTEEATLIQMCKRIIDLTRAAVNYD